MNFISTLTEIDIYLEALADDDRYKAYINSSLDELDHCIVNDHIAKSLLEAHEPIRKALHKKVQGGDFGKQTTTQLQLYARSGINLANSYSSSLDTELRDAVLGQIDPQKKDRNLSRINTLTGLFITDLLNRGYSPTHLYNRAEMFSRLNNYGRKSFLEQYDHVIGRIRTGKSKYQVIYGVEVHSAATIIPYLNSERTVASDQLDVRFEGAREKLSKSSSPSVFVMTEIESTDHVSAAWRAKEHIESQLDYALTLEKDSHCRTSGYAAVGWNSSTGFDFKNINVSLLQNFLTSEGGTYFGGQRADFRKIGACLNDRGREQLTQCFRHIRLSKESDFLEEKLLNMWIALESIYSFGKGSIIENMLRYVPKTYAVFSLSRRVQYIRRLLIDNNVGLPRSLGDGNFTEAKTLFDIFSILHSEKIAKELFESIIEKDHLKFLILRYHEIFSSHATLSARIKASCSDVERQLRRIYATRNKIAHTGHYGNVRPQLITNLYDYTINSLHALYLSSQTPRTQMISLESAFNSFDMALQLIDYRLSLNSGNLDLESITPTVTL